MNKYLVNAMMLGTGLVIGGLSVKYTIKKQLETYLEEEKKELDDLRNRRSLRKKYVSYGRED